MAAHHQPSPSPVALTLECRPLKVTIFDVLQPELRLGGRLSLRADRHRAAAALAAALAPLDSELTALLASILADSRLEVEDEACNVEDEGSDHLDQRWRPQQQHQRSRRTDATAVGPLRTGAPRPAYPQPAPCAFLRPGQAFEGRQRVSQCGGGNPK